MSAPEKCGEITRYVYERKADTKLMGSGKFSRGTPSRRSRKVMTS
jgi:hypothetical protein